MPKFNKFFEIFPSTYYYYFAPPFLCLNLNFAIYLFFNLTLAAALFTEESKRGKDVVSAWKL